MLKLSTVEFIDQKNRNYIINQNQVESFPLIGGETAEIFTSKAWNQHGETFINAVMESFEGELIFILYTANKSEVEIEAARKKVIDICHPLNGPIKMRVTLNNGSIYDRDIIFTSAPIFPIGLENRNPTWQKVQLLYEAINPFWYAEEIIEENFKKINRLFTFPFTMSPTAPVIFGEILENKIAVNDGQIEAPVQITLLNACQNPTILNKTTGEFIKFKNLRMYLNDELIIDTTYGKKKVLLNGYNAFNTLDFSSTFFNLAIGENEIEFTDELGMTSATIVFSYKKLYITI